MRASSNPQYLSFLQFLKQRRKELATPLIPWADAMQHLGMNNDEFYAFIRPLQEARLVGSGIGVITIDPRGEAALLPQDVQDVVRQQLLRELDREIGRNARQDIELDQIVEGARGRPVISGSR